MASAMPASRAVQPVALDQTVHYHQGQAQGQCQEGQVANQTGRLLLQRRAFVVHGAERRTDTADLAARAGGRDTRQRVALYDQRAGVDCRLVVATGHNACGVRRLLQGRQFIGLRHPLANRHGLARQQGLVGPNAIGRD